MLCMAGPEKKATKVEREETEEKEIDPATFLFEDDDEEEDLSDLPPERDDDEDSYDPEDDDW
jgi:hypothetical protein